MCEAIIRSEPGDFQVTEELGWQTSGDGEHDYLWIEKTGANTEWVARQLARFADVPARDVGYAGLKDRHAVTRQWFSVPRWNSPDWKSFELEGVTVLDEQWHRKKLRRGAHSANVFRIVARVDDVACGALDNRLRRLGPEHRAGGFSPDTSAVSRSRRRAPTCSTNRSMHGCAPPPGIGSSQAIASISMGPAACSR